MKIVTGVLCVAAFVLLLHHSGTAGEIHMWQDAKGNWHITDQEPNQVVKTYKKHTYTPESPEAIRAFQNERARELRRQESIRQQNMETERYKQRAQDASREHEKASREQKIKWAREDLDRERQWKKRYDEYRDDSYFTSNKNYWNKRANESEREIMKKQTELIDLENTK